MDRPSSSPAAPAELEKIAFICGCGHSGTTLVATILSVHPEIFVPLYESGAFLGGEAQAIERLTALRAAAVASGKPILVEKTPRHVARMHLIRRLVPGAQFVLMVRDGRDSVASFAERLNGNFMAGLARWVQDNTFVLNQRDEPDVIVVRYEDLVLDPRREVTRVCDFLGVAFSAALLNYHAEPKLWYGKTEIRRTDGGGDRHDDLRNWQVNQPIFDGRGRWRKELPPAIVAEFDRGMALKLMQAFGYVEAAGQGPTRPA